MSLAVHNLVLARAGRALSAPLNFALAAGGALLVMGKNGSGKSTLLRTLAGLRPAPAGSLKIPETKSYIGHNHGLHSALSVGAHLDFWRGTSGQQQTIRNAQLLEKMNLPVADNRAITSLSAGQKRRLTLARLLLEKSALWLLDEPHTALDNDGVALLENMLIQHRRDGGMAVVASHGGLLLPEAETLSLEAAP